MVILIFFISGCKKDGDEQPCKLKGYAYYSGTTIPISGVQISIQSKSTSTDEEGFYEINNITAGSQTINATREGFDDASSNIDVIPGTMELNIELTSAIFTSKIYGSIVSKFSNEGVSDCKIVVLNPDGSASQLSAYSSAGGDYEISAVPQGSRTILRCDKCYLLILLEITSEDYQYDTEIETSFVDPRDGRVYRVVEIGDQIWMAENLNYGERIDGSINQEDNQIPEKYCYDNQESNCNTYGGLYQWNEAMQYNTQVSQGICPDGWHLPADYEWTVLVDYLGDSVLAGMRLKETGTTHWRGYNTSANNESGFTALPAGARSSDGSFNLLTENTNLWSSSIYSDHCSWYRALMYNRTEVSRREHSKEVGRSLRCIKD